MINMSTTVLPNPVDEIEDSASGDYCIVVYNNETNSFAEVIMILAIALNIDTERAELHAWDIHLRGSADVYFSSEEDCESRAKIISSIGIKTEVRGA